MNTVDNRTVARYTLVVIGLVLATLLVIGLAYETRRVLTWIVIAAFFAVALHPAVTWLERRAGWMKRWLATLIVFLLALVLIAGLRFVTAGYGRTDEPGIPVTPTPADPPGAPDTPA